MKYIAAYLETDSGCHSEVCDTPNEALKELRDYDDDYFDRNLSGIRVYHVVAEESVEVGGYNFMNKRSFDGKGTK